MEKLISNFNISSNVTKGNTRQLVICPKCNQRNFIKNKNKLTYQKIKSVVCSKCRYIINIGEIYNFTTGSKLHKMNKNHNQDTLDDYIWNDKYDNI